MGLLSGARLANMIRKECQACGETIDVDISGVTSGSLGADRQHVPCTSCGAVHHYFPTSGLWALCNPAEDEE